MREYMRVTYNNAEISERDTEFLECWVNPAHAQTVCTRLSLSSHEASIVPNAILNQILNACLWLTVYSDVLEPPERLLVVSEWYEDSVEKHIESGKTNE